MILQNDRHVRLRRGERRYLVRKVQTVDMKYIRGEITQKFAESRLPMP